MGQVIVYAVPVFLLLILVEGLTFWRRGQASYRLVDTYTNLACGIGSQLADLLVGPLTFAIYQYVYAHAALLHLSPTSVGTWVFAMVGVDFCYYWTHRCSHERALLWAAHVVHHQSEEYNFSVALRQTWFGGLLTWPFYLPLALLGVPPAVILASLALNLLYQFFIHTRAVRSLGPLDRVLNTPAHHRVHHGTNPQYLDRNYAGILIVWDRLFGTFEPEGEAVRYGILRPQRTANPLRANLQAWVDLARASAAQTQWSDRLRVWWKHPGWGPGDVDVHDAVRRAVAVPSAAPLPVKADDLLVAAYVGWQLVGAVAAAVLVMALGSTLPPATAVYLVVSALGSMALWEPMLAGSSRARGLELARLAGLIAVAPWVLGDAPGLLLAIPAHSIISVVCISAVALRNDHE